MQRGGNISKNGETALDLEEIRQIRAGGATGSIIGRNSFKRTKPEALALLGEVIKIYLSEA